MIDGWDPFEIVAGGKTVYKESFIAPRKTVIGALNPCEVIKISSSR
jgi:hypothetical protein